MPIHDWTRVEAGTFHAFHGAWITHLMEVLNGGLLPGDYYALSEQHFGLGIADVLTLHAPDPMPGGLVGGPGVAVAEAPPRVGRKLTVPPASRTRRRTLAIRHVSGHRVVALVEIACPANKDRSGNVEEIVTKVALALGAGVHVLLMDLFPPGRHDPTGLHGALWGRFDPDGDVPPSDRPLTLASYAAGPGLEAYVEHLAVGDLLPEMPLFLSRETYINVPLEPSYRAAYRGLPAYWRGVIETGRGPG